MIGVFRKAGDSLLQRIVPSVDAGACVPENGQVCCSCCFIGNTGWCFRYNCHGVCTASVAVCC